MAVSPAAILLDDGRLGRPADRSVQATVTIFAYFTCLTVPVEQIREERSLTTKAPV